MLGILPFYSILQNIVDYGIIAMLRVSPIHEEPEVREWSQTSDCRSEARRPLSCFNEFAR